MIRTVCWRRADQPGHDAMHLERLSDGWRMDGTVAGTFDGLPASLTYGVELDDAWRTRSGEVWGWAGDEWLQTSFAASNGSWRIDDEPRPDLNGCVDVDLSFTPATNLLPVRRLSLPVGGGAEVRAAWLRFPDMTWEPLDQRYERSAEREYIYSSGTGFRAQVAVDEFGLVERYGDIWISEGRWSPPVSDTQLRG